MRAERVEARAARHVRRVRERDGVRDRARERRREAVVGRERRRERRGVVAGARRARPVLRPPERAARRQRALVERRGGGALAAVLRGLHHPQEPALVGRGHVRRREDVALRARHRRGRRGAAVPVEKPGDGEEVEVRCDARAHERVDGVARREQRARVEVYVEARRARDHGARGRESAGRRRRRDDVAHDGRRRRRRPVGGGVGVDAGSVDGAIPAAAASDAAVGSGGAACTTAASRVASGTTATSEKPSAASAARSAAVS